MYGNVSPLLQDARSALRGLRSRPFIPSVIVIVMTVTMAMATITFSVVDGVALRPLPFAESDELVSLSPPSNAPRLAPARETDYVAWRDGNHSFSATAAARFVPPSRVRVNGRVEELITRIVTVNLFDVLRVAPAAGSLFRSEHQGPEGAGVVVISHQLWRRSFGQQQTAVGRSLEVEGVARTIIGVLPERVEFPVMLVGHTDVYLPRVQQSWDSEASGTVAVVARLKAGVTVEQASADVNRLSPAIVTDLHAASIGTSASRLWIILAGVTALLGIACTNVGTLLLARAVVRSREYATHQALGLPRRRIAYRLLFEGLVLAGVAAVAAVGLSVWGVDIAKSVLPSDIPRAGEISVNWRVLSAVGAAVAACGVLFAAMPIARLPRLDLVSLLRTNDGNVLGGHRRQRAFAMLIVTNAALLTVLILTAALVVGTYVRLEDTDVGFERDGLLRVDYVRSLRDVPTALRRESSLALRDSIGSKLLAEPGVSSLAYVRGGGPLSRSKSRYQVHIDGIGQTSQENSPETLFVSPNYFGVMGMRLLEGRSFSEVSQIDRAEAVVLNDVAARRYFPDKSAIGQTVVFRRPMKVVGVVQGVPTDGPESEILPQMYVPMDAPDELPPSTAFGGVVVRTSRETSVIAQNLLASIQGILKSDDTTRVSQFDAAWREVTASRRSNAMLMGAFGLAALGVGGLGIAGTTMFVVAQQRRNFGLRLALGASPVRLLRGVMGWVIGRALIGASIGAATSWASSTLLAAHVFGVSASDPRAYMFTASVLVTTSLAAAVVPAMQAARLSPQAVLRDR